MKNKKLWLVISGVLFVTGLFLVFYKEPIKEPIIKQKRHLSGIFKVPPGETVNKDTKGRKLPFQEGNIISYEVLDGEYRNLVIFNENIPSIGVTEKKTLTKAINLGNVELKNNGRKDIYVQVKVKPYK